jgi:predicted transcriptional regulator
MPADRLLHPRLGHSDKVNQLSDLEFRVWVTYELTADDYGVMRKSAVTVQAAHESLNKRKATVIQSALNRLVEIGLLHVFDHQGRQYVYQRDWQNFQRVKHPRDTMQPAPPSEELEKCTHATRKLFEQHPANRSEGFPQDFGNISEMDQKGKSEVGSLACARTRETANGYRQTANGSEGVQGDSAFARFQAAYPAARRKGGYLVEQLFVSAYERRGEQLFATLENHKASEQWENPKLIPGMDLWFKEERWRQTLPPKSEAVGAKKPFGTWRPQEAS